MNRWRGLGVHLVAAAYLLVGPEFEVLRPSVGFARPGRFALAAAILVAALLRRRPAKRATRTFAVLLAAAVQLALLIATKRPGSLLWSLYIVSLWENARDEATGRLDAALSFLVPAVAFTVFAAFVPTGSVLAVPIALCLIGPALYLSLRTQARRMRASEAEALELEEAAAIAKGEAERLRVLAGVDARLRAKLAALEEDARRLETALAGNAGNVPPLATSAREALHELRDAVWALDPRDESWEVVESQLRRMAFELGARDFDTSAVDPARAVPPAERLALLRQLRARSSRLPGARVRLLSTERALTLEIEEDAASMPERA